jgi:hypothetical protein
MLIAIDGYNFIKQSPELRKLEQIDLGKAREGLVEKLAQYKRIKGHSITVVFDGWQEGRLAGHREHSKGIEIVFSRLGEKADEVLKRLAGEKKEGIVLVTSDLGISHFAEKKGAKVIGPSDFGEKMEMARFYALKGGPEEDKFPHRPVAPDKKGPSRRLSKNQRKALAAAKKL